MSLPGFWSDTCINICSEMWMEKDIYQKFHKNTIFFSQNHENFSSDDNDLSIRAKSINKDIIKEYVNCYLFFLPADVNFTKFYGQHFCTKVF